MIRSLLALVAFAIGAARPQVAHAETFNVPCDGASLTHAITDANDNEEEDFLWLAAPCAHSSTATLVIAADAGHPVTIYGNGAAIRGNHGHTVFAVNAGATLYLNQVAVVDAIDNLGGGILNNGSLALTDSVVTGNEASFGAGILNRGTLRLTNSTVAGNTAAYGGGIYNEGGRLTLTRSTLSGNGAREGGGIYTTVFGRVRLANSTVSGNRATAGPGGGIFVLSGEVALSHSTFSGNSATVGAGGIHATAFAELKLDNSIIANSTGVDCVASAITISGGNWVEDNTCVNGGPGTLSGDPLLGALEGSPGYHPLLKESQAIDAGDDASCPGVDQRGALRPQDGDRNKVATCDLGAYEVAKKKKEKK